MLSGGRSSTVVDIVDWDDSYTKGPLYNSPKECLIFVPADLVEAYKNHGGWGKHASQIVAIEDYPNILAGGV